MADVTLRPGAPRVGRDHFKTVLAHDERVHTGRACRLARIIREPRRVSSDQPSQEDVDQTDAPIASVARRR